jgi:AraC-like DNA-binding protein
VPIRADWLFRIAQAAQTGVARIRFRELTSVDAVRSYLLNSAGPPQGPLEEYVLDGLMARAYHALRYAAGQEPAHSQRSLVARAADLLEHRFTERWTIPRLAQELGTNRFSLVTDFKTAVGVGVHQYLLRIRVREANSLIAAGEKIEFAALAVGFSSKSGLYRAFRSTLDATSNRSHPSR